MSAGLLLCVLQVHAGPDPTDLRAGWAAAQPALSANAQLPPTFRDADLKALAAGHVVRSRVRLDGADRVVGAYWSDRPRDALWVAILDDKHDKLVAGLTEVQLPGTDATRKLLYQRLDLPWPFDPRQWVVEIRNNQPLHSASGGQVWERTWTLAAPETAGVHGGEGIWVPVNDGGWMLLDIAGGTLMVYQVRTVVGGVVPDEAATRYALATMDDMLHHIEERSLVVPSHYGADHAPMLRPDGSAVPAW